MKRKSPQKVQNLKKKNLRKTPKKSLKKRSLRRGNYKGTNLGIIYAHLAL